MALHQRGEVEKAIAAYESVVARVPDVADVHSNLGAAYVQAGNLEKALQHYQRAVVLGNATEPLVLHLNFGLAYYKAARFDEAAAEFARVLEQEPKRLQAALLLADCYFRAGETKKVIEILEPLERDYPDDPALIYLLGTALIYDGQDYRGQQLVDRIFARGESVEAHLMLGAAHLMVQDYPSAAGEFEKALAIDPKRPSVNVSYGLALREMSRMDDAAEYFRRELEVNPYDFDSNLRLGIYLYKTQQDYEGAKRLFARALQVRPGDTDVRYHLGLVYLLEEDLDRALALLEEVVEEVPEYLESHVALTRLYYRLGRREEAQKHREIVERLREERDANTLKGMDENERARQP